MADVQLPLWIEYTRALGAPIVALVAAGIAGGIAYRQMVIARNKLKFDLFEKRMAIYAAAIEMVQGILGIDPMKMDTVAEIGNRMAPATWLLSKDVADYLNGLMKRGYGTITKQPLNADGLSDDERMALVLRLSREIMVNMEVELNKLNKLFAPYLEIEH
jgi:hypothetical protein